MDMLVWVAGLIAFTTAVSYWIFSKNPSTSADLIAQYKDLMIKFAEQSNELGRLRIRLHDVEEELDSCKGDD